MSHDRNPNLDTSRIGDMLAGLVTVHSEEKGIETRKGRVEGQTINILRKSYLCIAGDPTALMLLPHIGSLVAGLPAGWLSAMLVISM